MAVQLTLNKFPVDAKTKDAAGLPFGCVVQPFCSELEVVATDGKCTMNAGRTVCVEDVARCCECFGYINRYCYFDYKSWNCSLCGAVNDIRKGSRYRNVPQRSKLGELSSGFVDMEYRTSKINSVSHSGRVPGPRDSSGGEEEAAGGGFGDYGYDQGDRSAEIGSSSGGSAGLGSESEPPVPAFVAFVDTTGTEEQLELAKSAVLAGLEALAPNALFGLATFSDRIGLYSVKGSMPAVKYVALPERASEEYTNAVLGEVMPLKWFLADVQSHKEAFSAALESITTASPASTAGTAAVGAAPVQRFGPAIKALVSYLSGKGFSESLDDQGDDEVLMNMNPSGIAYSRVITLMHSPPSSGPGKVDQNKGEEARGEGESSENGEKKKKKKKSRSAKEDDVCGVVSLTDDFYLKMGLHASCCGISCDMFITRESRGSDYFDLASMRYLSTQSGGKIFYYASLEECNAPQDLFGTLSEPYAINGTFRIRTTSEFQISKSYGQLVEHHKYKNLYHVAACDKSTCFGFDFKFSSSGFSRDPELSPAIQLAFQYSLFEPAEEEEEGAGAAAAAAAAAAAGEPKQKPAHVMKQRLRIYTIQVPVAKSVLDLYDYVDARAVVALLVHKCGQVIFDKGLEEARSLVEDWVINLMGEYTTHLNRRLLAAGDKVVDPDVEFKECKALDSVPYYVYGMLRGDVFSRRCISENADKWVYLFCAYTSNPPKDIVHAFYPALSIYSENRVYRKNPLSRDFLKETGGNVYMVDTFFKVVVYYTREGQAAVEFPPPHDGIIRRDIGHIRMSRGTAPLVVFLREGIDDPRLFEDLLLEEAAKAGSGSPADYGFGPFMDVMRTEVQAFLEEEAS